LKHLARLSSAIIAVVMVMTMFGCSSEPPKPSAENVKATAALGKLEAMRKAYTALDLKGVLDLVSQNYKGGFSDFSGRVRKDTENFKKVEMKVFIDRVELSKDDVGVVFHWFGEWWDNDGKKTEGRGNAVFHFSDDEKMLLMDITGDSPFGISR
jgi:hypothetical protein